MLSAAGSEAANSDVASTVARTIVWYPTGRQWFAAIEEAIRRATSSIVAEFYIWSPGLLAQRLESLLAEAVGRGCSVRLLIDAYGSDGAGSAVRRLEQMGVQVAWFNPRRFMRLTFRNHRKLVVVDCSHAFIGGCNVGDEYAGDGVEQGWRDLGLCIQAPSCVAALVRSFERMWDMAPFNQLPSSATMPEGARGADWELFFAGAGRGGRRYRRQLHRDLGQARRVDVLAAYFVPTTRVRALLGRAAHRGKVRIIVPAASDVTIAHYASRHVLDQLSPAIGVYEYVPAMLHAKLVVADAVVYVGSANFDPRSLRINFDVMLRIEDAGVAAQARAIVEEILHHSRPYRIDPPGLRVRFYRRVAYAAMAWLDPLVARRKLRLLA